MFEQLPCVTRELANAFGDNEFLSRIQQVSARDFGASMDVLCADLDRENPYLGRVVRSAAFTAMSMVKDTASEEVLGEPLWDTAKVYCGAAIVAVLGLVDQAVTNERHGCA